MRRADHERLKNAAAGSHDITSEFEGPDAEFIGATAVWNGPSGADSWILSRVNSRPAR